MGTERKNIVWLVSWYPNRYGAFDGDFIQRHARAAALFNNIHVLFVKNDVGQIKPEIVVHREVGLTEQIVYLPHRKGLAGKLQNFLQWKKILQDNIDAIINQQQPQFIHVHVPWKAGLGALWAKKKYNIPFLVTEHWGIYNRVVADNIYRRHPVFRFLVKRIFREAKTFVPVSHFLGEGVSASLIQKNFTVIPNVTDTSLFFPSEKKNVTFTFIHVSNMVPLKNAEGILQAFHDFLGTGGQAKLVMVGNQDDRFKKLAFELKLSPEVVHFKGEVPYAEVAREMQASHALIVNSDMENSPCVIGEALCCGLPIIATRVGGIPELLSEENGLLIEPRNTSALTNAMQTMVQVYNQYNTGNIALAAAHKFSYEVIGARLHTLYTKT